MSNVLFRLAIVAAVGVIASDTVGAQTVVLSRIPPVTSGRAALVLNAAPAKSAPVLDGRLDDAQWAEARVASNFVQQMPDAGKPATQATDVRVIADGDALYVAMRLHDTAADSIVSTLARRDYNGNSDWAHLLVDSFHDRRTAFHFAVNPSGVKRDGYISGDSEWSEDFGWDAVWDVATRRDSLGWTAEFRIPLSQLRFSASGPDSAAVWGIEFGRELARRGERSHWAPIPPNSGTFVSQFGSLVGVPVHEAKRRLEISPYAVARTARSSLDRGNPLRPFASSTATMGADFKVGLTSDLTLTGTVNPDFGQVEADPSEVNLTGAETVFSERRAFFTEGLDLFQYNLTWGDWLFGQEQLFYSRRIGRAPQLGFPDSADQTSALEPTRMLAAGKLSGRVLGWRLGVLSATTAEEVGQYTHPAGVSKHVIEPLTHYGVFRLARDFDEGRGGLGVIGTATNRRLGGAASDELHASAFAGGLEGRRRFGGGNFQLAGYVLGSRVAGSTAAIAQTQTSFQHLFQRDPSRLGLDSSATSLSGLASEIRFSKMAGGRSRVGLTAHVVTRGFDVNDLGYLPRTNFVNTTGWVGRVRTEPTAHTREWSSFVNWWALRSLHGPERVVGANWFNSVQFQNYWQLGGWVERTMSGTSVSLLRGGPALRTPGRTTASYSLFTDRRRRLTWILAGRGSPRTSDGSWQVTAMPGAILRPMASAELELRPSVTWQRTGTQYIDDAIVVGDHRYLVGDLRQRTASVTARGSFAFTPTLTIQAYAQPFVSNGHFLRAGEVASPLSRRHDERVRFFAAGDVGRSANGDAVTYPTRGGPTTLDNPDFSITNLNANAVLRWEYRAGSTLYAVWSQGRSGSANDGTASLGGLSRDLWTMPSANVFLLKWSHYLGR